MCACQSPECGRKKFRAAARGRTQGYQPLDSRAARIWQAVQGEDRQLDVPDRAGAGTGRAKRVSTARQGAGRIEFDQRPALYPRSARGLRPLASARQPWLSVGELNVVRRDRETGIVTICPANTPYKDFDVQTQPRANPQAYLAPGILVCEGKTEVGLVRGLDDFWVAKDRLPFSTAGVVAVSGGGVDNAPVIAGYFRSLGYRVGLLLDSDCEPDDT